MDDINFLHPFTCQQTFGSFNILAAVNNAAMYMGVQISFQVSVLSFFSEKYPGGELLDHMVVPFLIF